MRFNHQIHTALPGLVLAMACLLPVSARAQAKQAITLDPPTGLDLQSHTVDSKGNLLPPAPANFQRLGEATVGELADLHTLTLRFSQTLKITGISITKDFKVEQGGSCVEGNVYAKDTTCRLLVRFTPQGPGNRLGKLTVTHTGSVTPDAFGLGGFGYSPVLSFIPSIITTVPGTYPSGKGLLSGALQLTVDGGDSLYIADSGNGDIRYIDSSGTIQNIATGQTDPVGIAVDSFGVVWFSETSANSIYAIFDYGLVHEENGTGTDACIFSTPACYLGSEAVYGPGQMSFDGSSNLFFADSPYGAAESTALTSEPTFINLNAPFTYQESFPDAFAVDSGDNLYSFWAPPGDPNCQIVGQTLYNATQLLDAYNKIAGGRTCGFSGDGGLAANAEIGKVVSGISFDTGGNMYFTDTNNQRVRRVDRSTGIIRTVAGNGTAGYTGDGSGSTAAELSGPTGVGVDSQGQVYIISSAATGQVIRKITAAGVRYLGSVLKGVHSAAGIVTVTNTGNSNLVLTNTAFTGANPTEFSIDPTTTSCILTQGATMISGQTCQIGFICTPQAAGLRSAVFTMLDNSATNSNTVNLSCTGVLPAATFKITSPSSSASYTSGTAVPLKVSVTSGSGPAPTATVQFKVDGANYGSPVTISSGAASTSVTGLSSTSHTLSATYSGDSNYAAGGPVSVSITVTGTIAHQPTVTLLPLMSTSTSCGPLSFQVAVTGNAGSVPTGTVHLMNGQSEVAAGSLAVGKAVLTAPPLHPGNYSFTAHYGGDAHNQPAVSQTLTQTVSQLGGCLPTVGTVR